MDIINLNRVSEENTSKEGKLDFTVNIHSIATRASRELYKFEGRRLSIKGFE